MGSDQNEASYRKGTPNCYYGLFGKLRIDAHRGLIKRFADQEVCRSRGLQIRWVADQMGCRSGGLQIKRVAGQWRLRTGVHDAGKEGFRKVGCRQRIYIYKKYEATSPRLHTGDFLPVLPEPGAGAATCRAAPLPELIFLLVGAGSRSRTF